MTTVTVSAESPQREALDHFLVASMVEARAADKLPSVRALLNPELVAFRERNLEESRFAPLEELEETLGKFMKKLEPVLGVEALERLAAARDEALEKEAVYRAAWSDSARDVLELVHTLADGELFTVDESLKARFEELVQLRNEYVFAQNDMTLSVFLSAFDKVQSESTTAEAINRRLTTEQIHRIDELILKLRSI